MDEETIRQQLRNCSERDISYYSDTVEMDCSISDGEAHISHFHVSPAQRGQGLASKFMALLFEELRERNISSITVTISATSYDPDEADADDYIIGAEFWDDPTVRFLDDHGFSGFDADVQGQDDEKIVVRGHRFL